MSCKCCLQGLDWDWRKEFLGSFKGLDDRNCMQLLWWQVLGVFEALQVSFIGLLQDFKVSYRECCWILRVL